MRSLLVVPLLLALAACGSDDPAPAGPPSAGSTSATPGTPETEIDLAPTRACELVRDGIDAFNVGDLNGTVDLFEQAVPEAERLVEDSPSDLTRELLDAVRYYADLPAADYVEANVSDPEFLRYKDFTLTECAYGGPPVESADPGIPA